MDKQGSLQYLFPIVLLTCPLPRKNKLLTIVSKINFISEIEKVINLCENSQKCKNIGQFLGSLLAFVRWTDIWYI